MSVILFTSSDSPLKAQRTHIPAIAIIQNHSFYLNNKILFFYFTLISTNGFYNIFMLRIRYPCHGYNQPTPSHMFALFLCPSNA